MNRREELLEVETPGYYHFNSWQEQFALAYAIAVAEADGVVVLEGEE